jgi:hypothetical protein
MEILDINKKEKKCNVCNLLKSTLEFYILKGRYTHRYFSPDCKECRKQTVRNWRKNNKEIVKRMDKEKLKKNKLRNKTYVNKIKDVPCKDCNKKYDFFCMEFDHCKGKKQYNISDLANMNYSSLTKIKNEIEKCEVVCVACHRLRSFKNVKKYQNKFVKKIDELKTKPCTDCKKRFFPIQMYFDHITDKKIAISVLIRKKTTWQEIESELAKCELVCCLCHRKRTYNRYYDLIEQQQNQKITEV